MCRISLVCSYLGGRFRIWSLFRGQGKRQTFLLQIFTSFLSGFYYLTLSYFPDMMPSDIVFFYFIEFVCGLAAPLTLTLFIPGSRGTMWTLSWHSDFIAEVEQGWKLAVFIKGSTGETHHFYSYCTALNR